jgi:hypothetical protein
VTGYLTLAARALIATVFAAAFLGKVRGASRFGRFTETIGRLAILPERAARGAALAIVAAEGTAAVLLVVPATVRGGFVLAIALLVVFVAVAVRAVRGGIFAECRCFGSKGAVMGHAMIARNLLLISIAALGLAGAAVPTGHLPAAAAATLAGAAGALVFVRGYDRAVAALMKRLVTPADAEAHQ